MRNNGWVSVDALISTSGTELSAFVQNDVTALSQLLTCALFQQLSGRVGD